MRPLALDFSYLGSGNLHWATICFYVTPIGDPDKRERKHSDLFKSSVIEPAIKELNLRVVRADEIENPGMIAASIIQHLRLSRLVIADLSTLNPNLSYQIAIRHACKMPIVQIHPEWRQTSLRHRAGEHDLIDNVHRLGNVPQPQAPEVVGDPIEGGVRKRASSASVYG